MYFPDNLTDQVGCGNSMGHSHGKRWGMGNFGGNLEGGRNWSVLGEIHWDMNDEQSLVEFFIIKTHYSIYHVQQ